MTANLNDEPVARSATLPDGSEMLVRVAVADDPYVGTDTDTVAVELVAGEEVVAVVNSVLEVDQTEEAAALADEIVAGLESGELEPTAGAIEPLAERLP